MRTSPSFWSRLGLILALSLVGLGSLVGNAPHTAQAAEVLVEPQVAIGSGGTPSISGKFLVVTGCIPDCLPYHPEVQGIDLSTAPPTTITIASGTGITAPPVVNGNLVAWGSGGTLNYYTISTKTLTQVTIGGTMPTITGVRVSDPVILALVQEPGTSAGSPPLGLLKAYQTRTKQFITTVPGSTGVTATDISGPLVALYDAAAKTIAVADYRNATLTFSFPAPFPVKSLRLSGTTLVVDYQVPQAGQPNLYVYQNSPLPFILDQGTSPALSGSLIVYVSSRGSLGTFMNGLFGYNLADKKPFVVVKTGLQTPLTPDISGTLCVYGENINKPDRPVFISRLALVVDRFQPYFDSHDGVRLLGYPISRETQVGGFPAQYFQKGRLEDQRGISPNPLFQFQYGLLAAELTSAAAPVPVGGDTSDVTYATIQELANPSHLRAAPPGFTHGFFQEPDGTIFIPLSPILARHSGHTVPLVFWTYMNRADLFPAGWLHDIGLPTTQPFTAHVTKFGQSRTITVQAFQRTILTSDPLNPVDFQVERANVGLDYAKVFPDQVPVQ